MSVRRPSPIGAPFTGSALRAAGRDGHNRSEAGTPTARSSDYGVITCCGSGVERPELKFRELQYLERHPHGSGSEPALLTQIDGVVQDSDASTGMRRLW